MSLLSSVAERVKERRRIPKEGNSVDHNRVDFDAAVSQILNDKSIPMAMKTFMEIVVAKLGEIDDLIEENKKLRTEVEVLRKENSELKKLKLSDKTTINWDLYISLAGLWEDAAMDNVHVEHDPFHLHDLHDSARGAESLKTTKRHLSPETLELIRQCGAARTSCNYQLTFEPRWGRAKFLLSIRQDAVFFSTQNVAVPSQASFAHLARYRRDTELLPNSIISGAVHADACRLVLGLLDIQFESEPRQTVAPSLRLPLEIIFIFASEHHVISIMQRPWDGLLKISCDGIYDYNKEEWRKRRNLVHPNRDGKPH
ncbi:unnamed protein product [Heligmosomoides polygyrus]|uniref:BHLH domain-containing protein n=2 Tax=Heligmosomoides polygyrus TaxID=6339 RepID=A0A3P8BP39_HELPZ|nr:unnamed protein product [Heligmosomoides polygyrus]